MKTNKGAIGHVVAAPYGTGFMREPKRVDKTTRCTRCGGPGLHGTYPKRYAYHQSCSGFRWTVERKRVPCECPCRKGLALLDPNL